MRNENIYKNTKSEINLRKAFAAESKARNKYTYYASAAKKAGYEQIAAFFQKTADNEKEHAKIWFKELGLMGDFRENLYDAVMGEREEWTVMYKKMEDDARAEGFDDLAEKFRGAANIEKMHEARFKELLRNLDEQKVFRKDEEVIWECRNCGNIVVGPEAPETCPVCDHPQAYYEVRLENYIV